MSDAPNVLLNILCFFFPWMGLFVYLALKGVAPRKARSVGVASLSGLLVQAVIIMVVCFVFLMPLVQIVQNMSGVEEPKAAKPAKHSSVRKQDKK